MSINPPQLVQLPANSDPSYRIVGGSGRLIEALAETLAPEQIQLNTVVKSISQEGAQWRIETEEGSLHATGVITTLPPKLLVRSITFQPALPAEWVAIAEQTHTWMGESIKIGLSFPEAFWQRQGSGTVFSNVGPVSELYDHTSSDGQYYALKGFLNAAYHSASREERRQVVIEQLRRYYGAAIDTHTAYEDLVWRAEPFTFHPYTEAVLPHQYNGHPVFREELFGGRLIVAGSETAPQFPGYMDGAVHSGLRAAARVEQGLSQA
jgi:monoamine oxidase